MAYQTVDSKKNTKPPTMSTVARHAGVSRASVYAVLSTDGSSNIGVSEETRSRILQCADELGYVRNQAARSLVSGKTHSIGVIVQSLKTRFFTDFFVSLDDLCYADGYAVSISSCEFDCAREARHLEMMLSHRVDGLIFAWTSPLVNYELIQKYEKIGIPVVLLGSEWVAQECNLTSVGVEPDDIVNLMVDELDQKGHRRVAFLAACEAHDDSRQLHNSRTNHFAKQWLQRTGEKPLRLSTDDTEHGGAIVAEQISAMPIDQRPTAVACSTDMLAMGLVMGLRNRGLDVPGDVSVIGCDDIPEAQRFVVPLTTVQLPVREMAQCAWSKLNQMLNLPVVSWQHDVELIKPRLIARDSLRSL
jgi:LacI family transcriptional regulator